MRQNKTMELFSPSVPDNEKMQLSKKVSKEKVRRLQVKDVVLFMSQALTSVGFQTFEGELTSFKSWRSGFWYFDIKDLNDPSYLIPCIMPKSYNQKVNFKPKDGLKLEIKGKVQLFKGQMRAQIQVLSLKILGQGNFLEELHHLKIKLKNEGLFDQTKKQKLPSFIQTIGIITSPQGAVIQDLVKIIQERNNGLKIILAPSKVQGVGAEKTIAKQISRLDNMKICDVIIIGRGGGSFEDLFTFNKEEIARAIENSQTPIISAVGHESDHCIADYVADIRAATPSHAAEIVSFLKNEHINFLEDQNSKLLSIIQNIFTENKIILYSSEKKLQKPNISKFMKLLTNRSNVLNTLFRTNIRDYKISLKTQENRLQELYPRKVLLKNKIKFDYLTKKIFFNKPNIENEKNKLSALSFRLKQAADLQLYNNKQKLKQSVVMMENLSPLNILSRGYTIVSDSKHKIKTRASECTPNELIQIQFQDNKINAKII